MVRTSNLRKEEHFVALKRDTAYAADVSKAIDSFVCDGIANALQSLNRIAATPQYGGDLAVGLRRIRLQPMNATSGVS